ncbi:hypothetical protein N7490_006701 [Penicillium lividum]|nr:hypothetical protein N7490_006701 [Penicillium lividum]
MAEAFSWEAPEILSPPGDTSSSSLEKRQQDVIRQMVLPWTQVLYLFIDTESDRRAARCLLQKPHPQLAVGEDAIPDYMRVVIVQTESAHSNRYDKPGKTCVLLNASVDTEVLDLRHRTNLSDAVAFEPLRRLLLDRIHAIRIEQSSTCPPFSAFHLKVLWKQSIQHYGRRLGGSSFDCLSVARSSFPQNSSLGGHVREFVQQAKTVGSSENDVYAFVASAF